MSMKGQEISGKMKAHSRRFEELDSLRGLAAFSVMLSHFLATLPSLPAWGMHLLATPLYILVAGHEGVVFFFVLSGFVLTLPFLGNRKPSYLGYLTKRVLRIYSPFLLAVGSAMFLRELLYSGPISGVGEWFNNSWQTPVTFRVVIAQLVLIGPAPHNDYDPVIWSLFHEMRISIIFPLLIYMVIKKENWSIFLGVLIMVVCASFYYLGYKHLINVPSYFQTIRFTVAFILGALLAKHRNGVVDWFRERTRTQKWLLLILSIFLYTNSQWLPKWMDAIGMQVAFEQMKLMEFITMVGVGIVIVASLATQKASSFLTIRPLKFLGRISYSLYLYHAICLKVVVTLLHGKLPLFTQILIAFVAAIIVSTISYRLIEVPSMELGRWIVNRYFSKADQRPVEEFSRA